MPITITPAAAEKIAALKQQGYQDMHLRIFVSGGGCSGFQYGFTFDEAINENDTIAESGGVKLLIDAMSLELLRGAEVDYRSDVNGESFVIRNPNAASTCGCGKSFTPSERGGCAHAG
ncbi:MAG: iron-sulfur cluster insertion protein ErpA [Zetaproteobacteria bacterium]|nr:MAG: iron-sulfur cluster insertion protein ErpA [Zetaproteobacteria bacterium]